MGPGLRELKHAVIANGEIDQRAHHDHGDDWVVQHEAEKWLEHVVKYVVNKPTHTVSPSSRVVQHYL